MGASEERDDLCLEGGSTRRQPRRRPVAFVCMGIAALALAAGPTSAPAASAVPTPQDATARGTDDGKIRGVTLSTPRGSAEWGREEVDETMVDLRELGANWVAFHPYARIEQDGTVLWRYGTGDPEQAPRWLRRPIEQAHRQGLKVLVKPHLAHWGSFSWRGAIRFDDPEARRRFFRDYQAWIVATARFVADADAFAVGTELDGTVAAEAEWRRVIDAVRDVFPGPLTYAANWDGYEAVPFWDALDAVGIQAYFPLLSSDRRDGPAPTAAELDAGWERIMDRLRAFHERTGRHVVFTEFGYNRSARAPFEPWDNAVGGPDADVVQQRATTAALRAIAREPVVVGGFLWKWFPGDVIPRDFAQSAPEMRRLIRDHWGPGGP